MKKAVAIVLLMGTLALVGCSITKMSGMVIEASDTWVLIENETGKYRIPLFMNNAESKTPINIGDEIVVRYDGTIKETDPAQIENVYTITIKKPSEKDK